MTGVRCGAAWRRSGHVLGTAAEIRIRDGRQLRVFEVDAAVTAGNVTLLRNCFGTFSLGDGRTFVQQELVKLWTGSTASGSISVFDVIPEPVSPATSGKYWARSSESFQPSGGGSFPLFPRPANS